MTYFKEKIFIKLDQLKNNQKCRFNPTYKFKAFIAFTKHFSATFLYTFHWMGFKVNFTLNRSSTSFKSMNSENCGIEKLYTMQKPKKKNFISQICSFYSTEIREAYKRDVTI